jgi:hypothetical protein
MNFSGKNFYPCSDKKSPNTMGKQAKKSFSGKRKYLPKYTKLSRLTLPIKKYIDGTIV